MGAALGSNSTSIASDLHHQRAQAHWDAPSVQGFRVLHSFWVVVRSLWKSCECQREQWLGHSAPALAHSKDEFSGYSGLHTCNVIINNLKNQSYGNYLFRYQITQWKKIVQIAQKQNPLKFLLLIQSFSSILNENILQSETYMV